MCIIGRRWCSTSSAHSAWFSRIFSCHSGINMQRRRCGESTGEQEGAWGAGSHRFINLLIQYVLLHLLIQYALVNHDPPHYDISSWRSINRVNGWHY